MNTRTPRTLQKNEPSLARAGILFGVVILASLGIGIALSGSDDDAKQSAARSADAKNVSARTAPASSTSRTASANRVPVSSAETPVAVVAASGPVETAAAPAAEVTVARGPVTYAEAEAAFLAKQWDDAADLFRRYTEQKASNPWGHYMSGLAYRQTGDVSAAEAAFLACLAIDPDHIKSHVNLARVYLDDGRFDEAAESAQRAVQVDAENVDAHRVLARALHSSGRTEAALDEYAAALAIDPKDVWSLNNRGLILIEAGRFEESVEPLQAACALDGTQAVFHNNLGVALERTERFRGAEAAYAAAVALDSGYEKAAVSLARVAQLGGAEDQPVLAVAPSATPGSTSTGIATPASRPAPADRSNGSELADLGDLASESHLDADLRP